MAYDFSNFETKSKEIEEWLAKENVQIRSGRASINILDSIRVESYGSKMPINQLANINIEDAKTIRIVPWDTSQIKEIEKAITVSNLGLSASVDDKGLRLIFPDLTSERREALVKIAKQKLEDAKISVRKLRDEIWNDIQNKEKSKEISEDDKFRLKDDLQKKVDEINKSLEEMSKNKQEEIQS